MKKKLLFIATTLFVAMLSNPSTSKIKPSEAIKRAAAPEGTIVTYQGFNNDGTQSKSIVSGDTKDIIDGNDETSCRFYRPANGDYIQLEFPQEIEIKDVRIQYAINNDSEWIRGAYLKYSKNGEDFEQIEEKSQPNDQYRSTIVDLRNSPITAKYLRLEVFNTVGWVNIADFSVNNLTDDTPILTVKGFTMHSGQQYDMIDGKEDSYCQFERHSGEKVPKDTYYIQLEFLEEIEIRDLRVKYYDEFLENLDVEYSIDGSTYEDIDKFNSLSMTNAINTPAVIDLRNKPIEVKYLKFYYIEAELPHWFSIAEISWNTLSDETPSIVAKDTIETYRGGLYNLIDGNEDTFCWFNGRPSEILIDYHKTFEIRDIKIMTGKSDNGDTMKGILEYSNDNIYWEQIGEFSGVETLIDLIDKPISARYLKLKDNANIPDWVAIKEVEVNIIDKTITAEGDFVSADGGEWNNPMNMIDGDLDTAMWYDWNFSMGSSFILDLRKQQTVNNIAFFQGGYTYEKVEKRANEDAFEIACVYYSSDKSEWIPVGEKTYNNQYEIFIDLSENPIEARYIKVESQADLNGTGVVVREFAVNFEKVDLNFSIDKKDSYTYTGEQIIPSYALELPFGIKAETTFKDGKTPIKPGNYEMTITTSESKAYNSINETVNYTIMDTADHFLQSWDEMMKAVDGNICTYVGTTDNTLDELIDIYSNYLSKEDHEKVSSHVWNEESTIKETIDYIQLLKQTKTNSPENGSMSLFVKQISGSNVIIPITIVIAMVSTALFYFVEKRKKEND